MTWTREQWRALSERLARELGPELLDAELDALPSERLGDEAVELLAHGHVAGIARTLRDLLREGRLAAWVEDTCSAREAERLAGAFTHLLRASPLVGPDDPERLVRVPTPPREWSALRAWAARHELLHELIRPVSEVLPLAERAEELSLEACLTGAGGANARAPLAALDLALSVERHLLHEARRIAALPARAALWQRTPPAPLRPLVERLRALLDGATPAQLSGLHFLAGRAVSVQADSGVCAGQLAADDRGHESVEVQLYLAGYEQRAIDVRCSQCGGTGCRHTRALAGRLLDACLAAEDRLHGALTQFAARPSWHAFFQAAQVSEPPGTARGERIGFSLRVAHDGVSVGAQRQARQSDGSSAPGRLIAPGRALSSPRTEDADRALLELLAARSRTLTPAYVPADTTLLRALSEHPRVYVEGAREPLSLREEVLELRVEEQPDGLRPALFLGARLVPAGARAKSTSYLFELSPDARTLWFAPLTPALRRLLAALDVYRGVLPKESYPALADYLAGLSAQARVARPRALLGMERPTPRRFLLRIAPLPSEGVELTLSMRPFALSGMWPPGAGPELVNGLEQGQQVHVRRDLAWERQAAEQLLNDLDLSDAIRVEPFRYLIESTQHTLSLLSRAARLSPQLELEWAERAARLQLVGEVRAGDLKVALFKRGAFFSPEGGAQVGTALLAFTKLLDAARRGERYVRIEGNDFAEIERQLFERLQQAELCLSDLGKLPRLSPAALPYWLKQLGDVCAGGDVESSALADRAKAEDAARAAPLLPPELGPRLRAYQREGARFLASRARFSPGALLADEMGLGKTVQSIALLALRAPLGPAMVVCPTSLVDNWCDELARFAPQLRALRYRGAKRRELLAQLGEGAVLVLSYELLARDQPQFAGRSFATQVLDEAQLMRNARTQRARAVASLDVAFRVALSGTPLENRLGDVWSLFQLLAPGLLGSWPRFRARFAVPIERYDDRARSAALWQLIAPLMLRRRKDDVASELPLRTEVVHMVALSPPERDLYQSALTEARRALGKRRRDDPDRRMHVLAELTRLRQLACHPRLVIDDTRLESSKLAALMALLGDVLPRGHRVLIFSQFVAHLGLVREALERAQVGWLWLSGSTPPSERAQLVQRFQAGAAPVFLISLKAGGTGLNLTAADYVVHMDPWWNPSAEDQASDRAHRIGQNRPVSVIKLVAQDTIEERVLLLHRHKRRLAQQVIEGREAEPEPESSAWEALLAR